MRAPLCSRTRSTKPLVAAVALLAALVACQEVTVPNYNTPNAGQLLSSPDAPTVNATVVGLVAGMRSNVGTMALTLGILGREVMLLSSAEPRNISGFLVGPLEPGGFGIDMGWTTSYANLRTAVSVLSAVDKVPNFTDAQKNSIRGFVRTSMAIEYMNQLRIRDTFGLVISMVADPSQLQPFVTRDVAWAYTAALLDSAQVNLLAGGTAFPFQLTSGYAGFNTPATYLKFNRAIKARVDVYSQKWSDAITDLGNSFISTASGSAASLNTGVYHIFSTASGDAINPLWDPTPTALVAVPFFLSGAQLKADGVTPDARATTKAVKLATTLTQQSVSSNVKPLMYPTNTTSVPVIRNEELILMRAEANYALGNTTAALQDLNFIRVNSGGLAPLPIPYTGDIVSEILYNRQYSLFFEYGHRWVDMRRYGRLNQLEKLLPTHKIFPLVPIVINECAQRPSNTPKGCTQVSGF
jgi:hypothetical protein